MPSLQEVSMFLDQMQVVLLQSKSVQERQQLARRIQCIKITNLQISWGIVTRDTGLPRESPVSDHQVCTAAGWLVYQSFSPAAAKDDTMEAVRVSQNSKVTKQTA